MQRYLLQSAAVQIMDYTAYDQLTLTGPTSLSSNFTNGILTITGNGTTLDYINVFEQITYFNTKDEPDNGVQLIVIIVTDSPLTNGGSSTSNSINIS